MHILTLFLLLALRIEHFFRKNKIRPKKKLDNTVRYRIKVVGVDAELTAPDDVAKKFVKQCRVLVRDYILITVQEWNRPSSGGVPYVGDVTKVKLFDRLMIIFLLPRPDVNPDEEERANEELMQRVKKFALIKMADTSPTYP
jgi:hypothetical protein